MPVCASSSRSTPGLNELAGDAVPLSLDEGMGESPLSSVIDVIVVMVVGLVVVGWLLLVVGMPTAAAIVE